jgi:hypothetical protein
MDFRTELAKLGYNKGNSIDIETLINEILPSLFFQQETSYNEKDMKLAFEAGYKKGFSGYPNTENWKELPFKEWFNQFKK